MEIAGRCRDLWRDQLVELRARTNASPPRRMQGVCAGFRPGSSALDADGTMSNIEHNIVPTAPLVDAADPDAWHALDPPPSIATRRARRIDVRVDGDQFVVDAMFRDNSWQPDASEIAVHEYSIAATADRATGVLTSVHAEPRVLPYRECPAAAPNASRLVGQPLRGLRASVLATLRDTDCCTHLNDALRSLAEVPLLAAQL